MTVLIKILQCVVSLGLLIVLHEGGHFLFAKLFGTRVEKFYMFFDTKFHLFSTYDNWFRKLIGKQPVPKVKKVVKDDKGKETEYEEYEYQGTGDRADETRALELPSDEPEGKCKEAAGQ